MKEHRQGTMTIDPPAPNQERRMTDSPKHPAPTSPTPNSPLSPEVQWMAGWNAGFSGGRWTPDQPPAWLDGFETGVAWRNGSEAGVAYRAGAAWRAGFEAGVAWRDGCEEEEK